MLGYYYCYECGDENVRNVMLVGDDKKGVIKKSEEERKEQWSKERIFDTNLFNIFPRNSLS